MNPDIGGIVVIRPILLLVSNTPRAICGQCLLTKQSCFSRLRDIAEARRSCVTMCSRQAVCYSRQAEILRANLCATGEPHKDRLRQVFAAAATTGMGQIGNRGTCLVVECRTVLLRMGYCCACMC